MYGLIYKATNLINGKTYIGQTASTMQDRRYMHEYEAEYVASNKVFHKAIRKYGKGNFDWAQIDTADSKEELNEKEIFWIKHYNSYVGEVDYNGYNMTIGGDGGGYAHTDEAKKRMSDIAKARYANGDYIHPMKGKILTEEAKIKMSQSRKGVKLPPEHRENIRKGHIGLFANEKSPMARAVVQLTLNGEYIAEYPTAKQARDAIGVKYASNITECCRNKRKTAYKFKWMYAEDYKTLQQA